MSSRQLVVQVMGDLVSDGDPATAAARAIEVVLAWLREKQRLKLPPQAHAKEGFDLDASEGQPLSVVRLRNFWAMRLDRLDDEVPGRIWRTEVSIGHNRQVAGVGVRLTVIDTAKSIRFSTSVPRVVVDLIDAPGVTAYGVKLSSTPVNVESEQDAGNLLSLLLDDRRIRPVVVVSAAADITVDDINDMASRLAGVGDVFCLNQLALDWINAQLGNEFAISQRGLRTFNPKFDPRFDEINAHPPATVEWIARRFKSFRNFVWMLLDRFARYTITEHSAEAAMPTVDQVRAIMVEERLNALAKQGQRSEREALLEEQNALLEKSVSEKIQEFDYAAKCVMDAEEERDRFRGQLAAMRQRVSSLEVKLGEADPLTIPPDLDHLNDWVLENFPGRIQMLGRALRSAKKSVYEDVPLVYSCLAKLGRDYVDARREGLLVEGIFEPLGVQLERTGSRAHLSQWEEEYFFTHRKQAEFLEWHLKKGTGHSAINTLRIYFFYDEDDEMVIVGHLTDHLTNATT